MLQPQTYSSGNMLVASGIFFWLNILFFKKGKREKMRKILFGWVDNLKKASLAFGEKEAIYH